jgi:curved DNA-binding protein CbpA
VSFAPLLHFSNRLTAFRRALKEHPDKGGDKEKYQALQNAYEVLADDDKRKV